MNIGYSGINKEKGYYNREAVIGYDEKKEEKIVDKLIDMIEKDGYWKISGVYQDCFYVLVDDKKDFEDFKEYYKNAKKIARQL